MAWMPGSSTHTQATSLDRHPADQGGRECRMPSPAGEEDRGEERPRPTPEGRGAGGMDSEGRKAWGPPRQCQPHTQTSLDRKGDSQASATERL